MPASKKGDLSAAGRRLLALMRDDPDYDTLTKAEIAKRARINIKTYYALWQQPAFIKAYDKYCQDLVKESVDPIIKASIREGRKGSHQDRKMILEMAGAYQPKGALDITVQSFEDLLAGMVSD